MTASKLPFRGIIQRMAEMKDMYKLAKYVASAEYDSIETGMKEVQTHQQALWNLSKLYKAKSGESGDIVTRLIETSMEHGYIKTVGNNRTGVIYDITPIKGNHLIAKKLGVPVGLIDESLKNYGTTVALLAGGGVGAILLYLAQLIFGH